MLRWRATAAALLAGTLLAARSSFDYTEAGPSPDELLRRVAETELTDVTRTIVRDGRVVAEIQAQRVLNFRRRARTILLDVQYTEYDAAGNAVTTGSAERTTCYTERKDAELAGSIRLRSDPALGGPPPPPGHRSGDGGGDPARRRLPGDRQRPGGGRAAQDDPLHQAGQRHPGHPDRWFRTAVTDGETQAVDASTPFDDGRRVRGDGRTA